MYEIERQNNRIIVTKGKTVKLDASIYSYIVYREAGTEKVVLTRELTDEKLLLTLANAVDIPTSTS